MITEHERTHTGEKPEICAGCGKGFNAKKTLKNHERLHTGEKPYKCQHCDNCFAQRTSLNVHMQSHHKDVVVSQPRHIKVKEFSGTRKEEKLGQCTKPRLPQFLKPFLIFSLIIARLRFQIALSVIVVQFGLTHT